MNKTIIVPSHLKWGVLVWKLPDGKILADSDGNVLSMDAMYGDPAPVNAMKKAAHQYGFPEGETVFLPGRKKTTDMFYEEQLGHFKEGNEIPGDTGDIE